MLGPENNLQVNHLFVELLFKHVLSQRRMHSFNKLLIKIQDVASYCHAFPAGLNRRLIKHFGSLTHHSCLDSVWLWAVSIKNN